MKIVVQYYYNSIKKSKYRYKLCSNICIYDELICTFYNFFSNERYQQWRIHWGGGGYVPGVGTTFFDDQCFYMGTYGWKHPLFYLGLEPPPRTLTLEQNKSIMQFKGL